MQKAENSISFPLFCCVYINLYLYLHEYNIKIKYFNSQVKK